MKQPTIKTKKFILRPLKKGDAESLANHANNKKVSRFLAEAFHYPYTQKNADDFIKINIKESSKKTPRFLTFGIEISNEIAGTISVKLKGAHQAEIGFWLGEKYWGNKIMTNVIREIVKYCFNKLNLNRVEARVIPKNIASQTVLDKNGFKIEGNLRKALFKNNKFYNLVLMAKIR